MTQVCDPSANLRRWYPRTSSFFRILRPSERLRVLHFEAWIRLEAATALGRRHHRMLALLVLVALAMLLFAVGILWLRDREKELRQELRSEVLRKLSRRAAHADGVIDELRRSGSVRISRVYSVLSQLEREGLIAAHWDEGRDGRPRRVYSATGEPPLSEREFEAVVATNKRA